MHPLEHLRFVARAVGEVPPDLLVREAAEALVELVGDDATTVVACRRLLDASPESGALWNLCSEVIGSLDPAIVASEHALGRTGFDMVAVLETVLADNAAVVACGVWSLRRLAERRPDLSLSSRPLDLGDESPTFASPTGHGIRSELLGPADMSAASAVLVETPAASADGVVLAAGQTALCAAAHAAGVARWLVVPPAAVVTSVAFSALSSRLADPSAPVWRPVPWDRFDFTVVGRRGIVMPSDLLDREPPRTPPELVVRAGR